MTNDERKNASPAAVSETGAGSAIVNETQSLPAQENAAVSSPAASASGSDAAAQPAAPAPASAAAAAVSIPPSARWYAIHVYSGFEQKVLKNIQYRLEIDGLSQHVARLLIPTHEVIEIKDGKKAQAQRNLMPGYVLIQMRPSEHVVEMITSLPGVAGFVDDGTKPIAMEDEEVERLLAQTSHRQEKPKTEIQFAKGEQVKIIEGPLVGFNGQVSEIDPQRGKLSVMVSIFGRQTAVELDVLQVDKI
ncbi:MAG: transcription termination/antitermination protein NusG [Candidatus Sumerlaeota bacterium]|nr:transcription termination/antitermination protein NusG [Candidatus Sumerlaeota bacterium]